MGCTCVHHRRDIDAGHGSDSLQPTVATATSVPAVVTEENIIDEFTNAKGLDTTRRESFVDDAALTVDDTGVEEDLLSLRLFREARSDARPSDNDGWSGELHARFLPSCRRRPDKVPLKRPCHGQVRPKGRIKPCLAVDVLW